MKKYFKIEIKTSSSEEAEMLIAELSGIHFYAFEEEDGWLMAYINDEDFDEKKLNEILPPDFAFTKKIIEEENWNQQWENSIEPVVINAFAAVRPAFSEPINNVKFDLVITPKMSFGTGHHATTHLMIEMMEGIDFKNKSVIDFGTGTGVLAILSEKLGASKITGIDLDDWSIANAAENIVANNCHRIILKQQSDLEGLEPTDILLANINLNVLKSCVSSIAASTKMGSVFLASGFLLNDETEIKNVFEEAGFSKDRTRQLNGWLAILFKKK